jgi:uncharacterized membrane protein
MKILISSQTVSNHQKSADALFCLWLLGIYFDTIKLYMKPQKYLSCIKTCLIIVFFVLPITSFARTAVYDWYIQNLDTKIIVNTDSSLDITERITADCGNAPGKHGIFRILPEQIRLDDGSVIKTPVKLISITDENGAPYHFAESRIFTDKTVTWKIGDPNVTVKGVNEYVIRYTVKNAISFGDTRFDELYWNLSGNFWDLEIDNFHAQIVFPAGVNAQNSKVDYYTGLLGSKTKNLAAYHWVSDSTLEFNSLAMFPRFQGVTASIVFPKNIFVPYQPSFFEKYGYLLWYIVWLLIPVGVFAACFRFWSLYGKDPKLPNDVIIPEYDAPGNLSPVEMGVLMKNGGFDNRFITAEIIYLATKGYITIKEIDNKGLFFHSKDYEFQNKYGELSPYRLMNDININNNLPRLSFVHPQMAIMEEIFRKGNIIKLSSLKKTFYHAVSKVRRDAKEELLRKGLIIESGLQYQGTLSAIAIILMLMGGFLGAGFFGFFFTASLIVSSIILFVFSAIMPKRTQKGAELNRDIQGFKLFLETVDKDRARFYEEENMFEKFLPYAILFDMTELWIKRMREIYGEEYFANYSPVWYSGVASTSFDVGSFTSSMSNLSTSIASNTSAPSGSGGGGGAGGGGGGGGGGGW